MSFRFVRSAGSTHEPAVVLMPGSGVIHPGGVVVIDQANNLVSPATSSSTTTMIFGVSQDYIQGNSDAFVRVIPFVQGQLWEADCANAITTANILKLHQLATDTVLRNITNPTTVNLGETGGVGIFLAYAVTGLATGSGKLLGSFVQRTPFRNDGFTVV